MAMFVKIIKIKIHSQLIDDVQFNLYFHIICLGFKVHREVKGHICADSFFVTFFPKSKVLATRTLQRARLSHTWSGLICGLY